MLIHQDNLKTGFEPVGSGVVVVGGVPCLCSGSWAVCQGGVGWVLIPKTPSCVFPGGNSAIPEEQKKRRRQRVFQ